MLDYMILKLPDFHRIIDTVGIIVYMLSTPLFVTYIYYRHYPYFYIECLLYVSILRMNRNYLEIFSMQKTTLTHNQG